MKREIEDFDLWLRQPGPLGIPRFYPVVIILIIIGALALSTL